jgi:hypothetical protein
MEKEYKCKYLSVFIWLTAPYFGTLRETGREEDREIAGEYR